MGFGGPSLTSWGRGAEGQGGGSSGLMEPRSTEGRWGVRGCLSRLKAEWTETREVARRQSLVGVKEPRPSVPLWWCHPCNAHLPRLFSSSRYSVARETSAQAGAVSPWEGPSRQHEGPGGWRSCMKQKGQPGGQRSHGHSPVHARDRADRAGPVHTGGHRHAEVVPRQLAHA